MSSPTLFQNIFTGYTGVINQQLNTNMIKIDSSNIHLAWTDIQNLFTDYYTNSVSFPSALPPEFSTIQTDISAAIKVLTSSEVSLSVAIGVTLDRSTLEYVQFSFTFQKTYSFDIPGTANKSVSIDHPTLTVFIYNPLFNAGYAKSISSLTLSVGVQFLGIDSQLQLSIPGFIASITSTSSLQSADTFLNTLGCNNDSLNHILSQSTATFGATLFIKDKNFNLSLSLDTGASCSWNGFDLQDVAIDLSYFAKSLSFSVGSQIQISDDSNTATVDITLADDRSGGLTVSGQTNFYPALDVSGVAGKLAKIIGGSAPSFPFDLSIVSLELVMTETTVQEKRTLSDLVFNCKADLVLLDSGSSVQFDVNLSYSSGGELTIELTLGDLVLTEIKTDNFGLLSATIAQNTTVSIQTLAQFFNIEALKNIPAFQNIDITGLFVAVDSSVSPKSHLVGLQLDVNETTQQNLLKFATGSAEIGLKTIVIFAANQKWAASDVAKISGDVSGFVFPAEIPQGPSLSVGAIIGNQTYNLPLLPGTQSSSQNGGSGVGGSPPGSGSGSGTGTSATQPTPISDQNSVRWFDVQKQLGPLYLKKIGFKLLQNGQTSSLELATDASVTLGPLEATLDDFSFTFPLTWGMSIDNLSIGLQGLNLSYSKPPLLISGGLLHTTSAGEDLYQGNILIETSAFLLSAFGEYAEVTPKSGDPFKSLALFAALNSPPLGGPIFCFVTGLAAGFGYNSQLNIPTTAEQIPDFALLTAAGPPPSGQPAPDISVITKCISPSQGEDWIAVGILFRSFEFINSTALLTAAFGNNLQFAILGQSEMSLPPASSTNLAYAQVDVEATYSPASGSLEVYGILTNNSYILSRDCHLTGGFAYILENNGNFVLTYGGYSPQYNYQQYNYPSIPRVQILWQIDSHTYIKGDQYFAITPAVMMAGGGLQATWSCGIFSAWFNVNVDLFMQWQPFMYSGDFSIYLGVSFDLHICFIHVHFSFQLGASMHIEGPPFRGSVHIDLDVISFTIHFGPSLQTPSPLIWSQFRTMLPVGGTVTPGTAAPNTLIESESPLIGASVTSGLLLDLSQSPSSKNDPDWIINGTNFCIDFHSSVPITELAQSGSIGTASLPTEISTLMGVLPMSIGTASGQFAVTITNVKTPTTPVTVSGNSNFNLIFTQKNMAAAHWGQSQPADQNALPQLMNCGLKISATRGTPDETILIPVSYLQTTPSVTAISNRTAALNPF